MFRKLKEEVLNLPQKTISDRYITIPNGQEYTLSAVKEKIVSYAQERSEYYTKNFKKYQEMYNTAIVEFEKTLTSSEVAGLKQCQTKVKRIKRIGTYSPEAKELTPVLVDGSTSNKKITHRCGERWSDHLSPPIWLYPLK